LLRAISFDFWNTLYDLQYEKDVTILRMQRLREWLADHGQEWDREQLLKVLKATWIHAAQCQRQQHIDIGPRGQLDFVLQQLGMDPLPAARESMQEGWNTVLLELPPRAKDGAKETLDYLSSRYKLALICNTGASPGSVLRVFMQADGIIDYFQTLLFSDEVLDAKPGYRIYQRMLANLGVNAHEAAHIGDDPETDVGGAHNAGLTAIWLAPAEWPEPLGCDQHVAELRELIKLY